MSERDDVTRIGRDWDAAHGTGGTFIPYGITVRQYAAIAVATGFMANKAMRFLPEEDANYIVRVADALLAELAK